jgi:shikimate dehydrogenase
MQHDPLTPLRAVDQYRVVGNPVEHSKSPWIHARFAQLTGQQMHYGRLLAPLDQFSKTLRDFMASSDGLARGCNVTVPFKFEAFAMASQVSERAALAGAANTLHFCADGIHADNTDGAGLVRDIEHNEGVMLAGKSLLLLGAGGAAAGVLGPLLMAMPQRITVANRTLARAVTLVQRHAALARQTHTALHACTLEEVDGNYDAVINATNSSLSGAAVPVAASTLRPGALAYDLMYGAKAQGFLDWAHAQGARPRDGLGMLVEQAAESFLIWRGVRPPSTQVLQELRDL